MAENEQEQMTERTPAGEARPGAGAPEQQPDQPGQPGQPDRLASEPAAIVEARASTALPPRPEAELRPEPPPEPREEPQPESRSEPARAPLPSLQQQLDQARAELLKMTQRAQEAEAQLKQALAERSQLLTTAAEAAQKAMEENEALKKELEQTRGEVLRLRLLQQRPELLPYAELLPATTDEAALQEVVERIEKARARDLERERERLLAEVSEAAPATAGRLASVAGASAGVATGVAGGLGGRSVGSAGGPASSGGFTGAPARIAPPAPVTPAELNLRLREAMKLGPRAYQEALNEAILLVNSGKLAAS